MTDTLSAPAPAPQKKPRAFRPRTWLGGLGGTLAVVALGWLLFAPKPVQVEAASVTEGPMQVTIDNQGQVRAYDKYIVAAPVAAELKRTQQHDGDAVRKNQTVAILSPLPMDARQRQEARAHLDAAKALAREAGLRTQRAYTDMQFAAAERIRIERLVNNGFVSKQALDKAITTDDTSRADWNAAKSREQATVADVKAAEAALVSADLGGRYQVPLVSPVDGYILKIHERGERTVNAGTPLVTIGDPTRYEVVVDVLSTDAVKIKPGALMLLEGWGGDNALRARVRLVEPMAFTKVSALGVEEQRVNVVADPVDALGPLGDGYRIEARIVIWAAEKATKVAGSSLFRVGDEWHVFVIEEGRARERAVKVGQRNQEEAQILAGLTAREMVIRYPNNQLGNGVRVVLASR